MKEISEYLYQFFTTATAFSDVMALRLYPVVANEETDYPFAVYGIAQQQGITKDISNFNVTLSGYFEMNKYDDAADFADGITDLVKDNRSFTWQNTELGFVQENQSFVANITFNVEQ